jgi:integrase/recombinase XerC
MNSIALKRYDQLALPEKGTDPDTLDRESCPVTFDHESRPATIDSGNHPATFDITWQKLTDIFLTEYRGATQRTYRDAWNQFLAFCGISLEMSVTRVPDEDTVKAFRDSLLDAGQSPNTINAYLAAVRAFYRFLHNYTRKSLRTGMITASRAGELQLLIEGVLAVRKVRTSNASGRLPTTVDQSRDLLASVPTDTLTDLRDRAMIALLIGCGLRRIELVRAFRKDLTPQNGQLLLRIQQKGHHAKDSFVVIWPDVERMLRPWLTQSPFKNPDSPLFPSLSKRDAGSPGAGSPSPSSCDVGSPFASSRGVGSPLTPRSISRIIRHRLDAIGLKDHSTHSLRHAFATIALTSDDVELRDVQQALGHSQITTTERYIHQSNRLAGRPEKAVNDIVFKDSG